MEFPHAAPRLAIPLFSYFVSITQNNHVIVPVGSIFVRAAGVEVAGSRTRRISHALILDFSERYRDLMRAAQRIVGKKRWIGSKVTGEVAKKDVGTWRRPGDCAGIERSRRSKGAALGSIGARGLGAICLRADRTALPRGRRWIMYWKCVDA